MPRLSWKAASARRRASCRSPGTIVAPSRTVIVVLGPIIIVRRTVVDRRPIVGGPTAVGSFARTVGARRRTVLTQVPCPIIDRKPGRDRVAVLPLVFDRTPAIGAVSHLHRTVGGDDCHNGRTDAGRLAQIKS